MRCFQRMCEVEPWTTPDVRPRRIYGQKGPCTDLGRSLPLTTDRQPKKEKRNMPLLLLLINTPRFASFIGVQLQQSSFIARPTCLSPSLPRYICASSLLQNSSLLLLRELGSPSRTRMACPSLQPPPRTRRCASTRCGTLLCIRHWREAICGP
jgi:hypothetical protein